MTFSPLGALRRLNPFHWSAGLVIRGMAELGIADHLAGEPRTASELAAAIGAHEPSLTRFLRVCELHELIAPLAPDRWRLTVAGELLRSDVPSLRGFSIAVNAPGMTRPWERIAEVVRTGEPATRAVWGMDHWEYYAANPDEARSYAETSATLSLEAADALVASYDFTGAETVVDIGGSPGTVLSRLLREVPAARGVLLDLDWAVPYAHETLTLDGVADRAEVVAGDFLREVPDGGSHYLLKNVLCDLDDDGAARLLSGVFEAAPPGSRLLLLDWEYTEHSSHVHANDVEFMVLTGGRARTPGEYEDLLAKAGFGPARRLPLAGHERAPIVLLESVRP
ncbi:methyltransferase [Streptomyces sp. NBC_00829]|uniref:methyltransferase n=1 Tax=Streptomyces sp. NBC_00829 TaxID=2903679 RepID=UPI00386C1392|nr:methyltransferase [Streptomyces sp. NBC_00829]